MQKYICPTAAYFDCGWVPFFILFIIYKMIQSPRAAKKA